MSPRPFSKRAVAAVLAAAALSAAAPAVWLARADADPAPAVGRLAAKPAGDADAAPSGPAGQTVAPSRPQPVRRAADRTPAERAFGPDGKAVARPGNAERPAAPRAADRPLAPGEWLEIAEFMSKYMPWRIAEVQRMPEGQAKERVQRLLAVRYRGLRALESRDAESYAQRLEQLRVEDQVYKLVSEWGGADRPARQKIRSELREQVTRLVDIDLQERKRNVDRLEETLRKQREALERDTKAHDLLVQRRTARFLDWGKRWQGGGPIAGGASAEGRGAKPSAPASQDADDSDLEDGSPN